MLGGSAADELHDAMVVGVGDVQHAVRADRDRRRSPEDGGCAVAGDGRDRAVGRDPSHAVVAAIGDVHVARAIEGQTGREVQIRLRGGTTVAAVRGPSASGEQDDVAAMIDPPHAVVVRVGDEEASIGRYRDSDRGEELGGLRLSSVT